MPRLQVRISNDPLIWSALGHPLKHFPSEVAPDSGSDGIFSVYSAARKQNQKNQRPAARIKALSTGDTDLVQVEKTLRAFFCALQRKLFTTYLRAG